MSHTGCSEHGRKSGLTGLCLPELFQNSIQRCKRNFAGAVISIPIAWPSAVTIR